MPKLGLEEGALRELINQRFAQLYEEAKAEGKGYEVEAIADCIARAVAAAISQNNQKVADDLTEQVARFMSRFGGRIFA